MLDFITCLIYGVQWQRIALYKGSNSLDAWRQNESGLLKHLSCFIKKLHDGQSPKKKGEDNDYIKGLNVLWHWGVNLLSINCVPLYNITGKCKAKWLESKGRNFNVSSTNSDTYKYNILRQVTVQQQPYTFSFSKYVFWQEYIQWCSEI